jgi:cell division protein FtsB
MSIKKTLTFLFFLFSLLLIFNLSREVYRVSQSSGRLNEAEERVEKEKLRNWQLKEEKKYKESPFFLEKEIRDKLMMGKSGEVTVILPRDIIDKIATSEPEKKPEIDLAIWQQWLEVFGIKI